MIIVSLVMKLEQKQLCFLVKYQQLQLLPILIWVAQIGPHPDVFSLDPSLVCMCLSTRVSAEFVINKHVLGCPYIFRQWITFTIIVLFTKTKQKLGLDVAQNGNSDTKVTSHSH